MIECPTIRCIVDCTPIDELSSCECISQVHHYQSSVDLPLLIEKKAMLMNRSSHATLGFHQICDVELMTDYHLTVHNIKEQDLC